MAQEQSVLAMEDIGMGEGTWVINVSMRKAGKRDKKAGRKLSGTPDKSGKISRTGREKSQGINSV